MFTQEKSNTSETKYLVFRLLVVGLLAFMWPSTLNAQPDVAQENINLDLSKKTIGIDQTNLVRKPKEFDLKEPLPNIIGGSEKSEHSKADASIIVAYVILGLFACLFVFYIVYTILEFWVISRREWTQRVGEPEGGVLLRSLPNSSRHSDTESPEQTDVVSP